MRETLALAVTHEPEGAEADVFGLDEAALERVVACTLASAGIRQPIEVSLLLTGDEALRALNRDYRGQNKTTDVLSFPLLSRPLASAPADQLWQPEDDEDGAVRLTTPHNAGASDAVGGRHTAVSDEDEREDDDEEQSGAFFFIGPAGEQVSLGDIAISRDAVRRQAADAKHSPAYELAYLLAHGVLHLIGYDDHTESGYQAMIVHQEAALACAGTAQ